MPKPTESPTVQGRRGRYLLQLEGWVQDLENRLKELEERANQSEPS